MLIKTQLEKVWGRLFEKLCNVVPVTRFPTCSARLIHMKNIGFNPHVIYDGGAFIGKWAREVANIFPLAKIVAIEPNTSIFPELNKNIGHLGDRTVLINAAVSNVQGKAELNVWENPKHRNRTTALAASSLLAHVQGNPSRKIEIEIKTLDMIMVETGLKPDLVKLDLQGGELKALQGGLKLLKAAELCVVEFGCLDAYIDRTTPRDLMGFFYDHEYVLYDIVDIRYRPFDGALMGGDFFFIKTNSKLKEHKDYF